MKATIPEQLLPILRRLTHEQLGKVFLYIIDGCPQLDDADSQEMEVYLLETILSAENKKSLQAQKAGLTPKKRSKRKSETGSVSGSETGSEKEQKGANINKNSQPIPYIYPNSNNIDNIDGDDYTTYAALLTCWKRNGFETPVKNAAKEVISELLKNHDDVEIAEMINYCGRNKFLSGRKNGFAMSWQFFARKYEEIRAGKYDDNVFANRRRAAKKEGAGELENISQIVAAGEQFARTNNQ